MKLQYVEPTLKKGSTHVSPTYAVIEEGGLKPGHTVLLAISLDQNFLFQPLTPSSENFGQKRGCLMFLLRPMDFFSFDVLLKKEQLRSSIKDHGFLLEDT